jgi:hypothetical protein
MKWKSTYEDAWFPGTKIRPHRKMLCNRISRQGLLPLKNLACKVKNTNYKKRNSNEMMA